MLLLSSAFDFFPLDFFYPLSTFKDLPQPGYCVHKALTHHLSPGNNLLCINLKLLCIALTVLLMHNKGKERNTPSSLTALAACIGKWEAFHYETFTEIDPHVVFRA